MKTTFLCVSLIALSAYQACASSGSEDPYEEILARNRITLGNSFNLTLLPFKDKTGQTREAQSTSEDEEEFQGNLTPRPLLSEKIPEDFIFISAVLNNLHLNVNTANVVKLQAMIRHVNNTPSDKLQEPLPIFATPVFQPPAYPVTRLKHPLNSGQPAQHTIGQAPGHKEPNKR